MQKSSSSVHTITTAELLKVITKLAVAQPLTDAYAQSKRLERIGRPTPWYVSQKQHLLGWLGEYGGAGFYGRKQPGQDAQFFYNHFRCPEGLMWLAEALGETQNRVTSAIDAVDTAGANPSSKCGSFRRVISWERIAELLEAHRDHRQLPDLARRRRP